MAYMLHLLFFVEFFDQDVGAYKSDVPNQHVPPSSVYDVLEVFLGYVADSREPRRGRVGSYVAATKRHIAVWVDRDLRTCVGATAKWREVFHGFLI